VVVEKPSDGEPDVPWREFEAGLVPIGLVAVTVHAYEVPLVIPVTTIGLAEFAAVSGPGVHEALKDVTAEPPLYPGVKARVAWLFPPVKVVRVGAHGAMFATFRTRWLLESAMKKSALPDMAATPRGKESCADVAGPHALEKPWVDPATVDTVPSRTMRMRWLPASATRTSLLEVTATLEANVLAATVKLKRAPPVAAPSSAPALQSCGAGKEGHGPAVTFVMRWLPAIGDEDVAARGNRQPAGDIEVRVRAAGNADGTGEVEHGSADDLSDAMVVGIGDVDGACRIHRHAVRIGERRCVGRHAVAALPLAAGPRDGGHRASSGSDPLDAVVERVRDVQVARAVQGDRGRNGEARAVRAGSARAEHRRDHAGRRHLADAVVVRIGDVDVARAVNRDSKREIQLRGDCRECGVVAVVARGTRACDRGDPLCERRDRL
jgi:hypothetical protein